MCRRGNPRLQFSVVILRGWGYDKRKSGEETVCYIKTLRFYIDNEGLLKSFKQGNDTVLNFKKICLVKLWRMEWT